MNWIKKLTEMPSKVMGMNERNLGLIYPNNRRRDYKLADDKYLAKEIFHLHGISCPQTYGVVSTIGEIKEVWQKVNHHDRLVIKPAKGAGGKGILILKQVNGQWYKSGSLIDEAEIFGHIANTIFGIYSLGDSDRVLIEEFVTPHGFFGELYPSGVPDFRIILLNQQPLMGMLRMPTEKSGGKANIHQGGLGIGVDMESGRLTQAYDGKKHLDVHPDSGAKITGKMIPYWDELIALSIQTAKAFPLNYLGVDLVIDREKGPMIMEVNVRPGLAIQLANKKGLKEVLTTLKS